MHLQIMMDEAGNCPICGMALIPMEVDEVELSSQQFQLTKHAAALANIETSVIGGVTQSSEQFKPEFD